MRSVNTLNSGCWTILILRCVTPPEFKVTVPTTTFIPFCDRLTVQWAAVAIHRIETIEPPQKCTLLSVRRDACDGICPRPTFDPPTILSLISNCVFGYFEYLMNYDLPCAFRSVAIIVSKRKVIVCFILWYRLTQKLEI